MPLSAGPSITTGGMTILSVSKTTVTNIPEWIVTANIGSLNPESIYMGDDKRTAESGSTIMADIQSQRCMWKAEQPHGPDLTTAHKLYEWELLYVNLGQWHGPSQEDCINYCRDKYLADNKDVSLKDILVRAHPKLELGQIDCFCAIGLNRGTKGDYGGERLISSINTSIIDASGAKSNLVSLSSLDQLQSTDFGSVQFTKHGGGSCPSNPLLSYYPIKFTNQNWRLIQKEVFVLNKLIDSKISGWVRLCAGVQSSHDELRRELSPIFGLPEKTVLKKESLTTRECLVELYNLVNTESTRQWINPPAQLNIGGVTYGWVSEKDEVGYIGYYSTRLVAPVELRYTIKGDTWVGLNRDVGAPEVICPRADEVSMGVGGSASVSILVKSKSSTEKFSGSAFIECDQGLSELAVPIDQVTSLGKTFNIPISADTKAEISDNQKCKVTVKGYGGTATCYFDMQVDNFQPCATGSVCKGTKIYSCGFTSGLYDNLVRDCAPDICVEGAGEAQCKGTRTVDDIGGTESCAMKWSGVGQLLEDLFGACGWIELIFLLILGMVLLFVFMMLMNLAG
jgi:hypothetical protein